MIRGCVYLGENILHRLEVNGSTVFSLNEDENADRGGDFSKMRIVKISWKKSNSNVYDVTTKVGCVRQHPVVGYNKETSSVTIVAMFGTPLYVAKGFLVMVPVDENSSPFVQLQELHYKTLQKFCRAGLSPPFDQLQVSLGEWTRAHSSGSECRATMVTRVTQCHLEQTLSREPLDGPGEQVSFVAYAAGCEAIVVESPSAEECVARPGAEVLFDHNQLAEWSSSPPQLWFPRVDQVRKQLLQFGCDSHHRHSIP